MLAIQLDDVVFRSLGCPDCSGTMSSVGSTTAEDAPCPPLARLQVLFDVNLPSNWLKLSVLLKFLMQHCPLALASRMGWN